MAKKEPKKAIEVTVENLVRMVGWQVAAGILFLACGLELAFSNIIHHALQPFEHGRNAFAALGLEAAGLQGLAATGLIIVGSLNLGFAAWRFGKALLLIDRKK